eukprot:1782175-Alexandrium_andersonii.AAC.1
MVHCWQRLAECKPAWREVQRATSLRAGPQCRPARGEMQNATSPRTGFGQTCAEQFFRRREVPNELF